MRPRIVELRNIFVDHATQLPLSEKREVIETFPTHAPDEAIADGIRAWGATRYL